MTTSRSAHAVTTGPRLRTAPVLGVLVCHDGQRWLPDVLESLRKLTVRPRHVLAVDTGSTDDTGDLLARAAEGADAVLDGVLTLDATTGFGDAVAEALAEATERWGDPGAWLWLVHDDSAPEPDCLENLLHRADVDAGAAMLGPLGLDWDDPRLVVDDGLSLDASGQAQTGMDPSELDPALRVRHADRVTTAESAGGGSGDEPTEDAGDPAAEDATGGQADVPAALQVSEVLAVSTACALVRREVFERLDGFDANLPLAGDELDLGWRINAGGDLVLCVPGARMRHAAAVRRGTRTASALPAGWPGTFRAAQRAHGVRAFLVNTTWWSFVVGVPRTAVLTLLRALGYLALLRGADAAAEVATFARLLSGKLGLREGRRVRREITPEPQSASGLLTSRVTRLRNGLRGAFAGFVRARVRRDLVLGREPDATAVGVPASRGAAPGAVVGPDALPSGALGAAGSSRRVPGLRRPSGAVVVAVAGVGEETGTPGAREADEEEAGARPRPSPVPRDASDDLSDGTGAAGDEVVEEGADDADDVPEDLVVVPVDRRRVVRELLLTPPVVLVAALVAFALVVHGPLADAPRFGPGLHGGRLLPAAGLGETWSTYLAAWHPNHAGTGSPAPAALLVLGVLGAVLAPVGGPSAVLGVLMLFGVPLAGMSAYAATRSVPVPRSYRALAAAAYALLPVATTAAAHGRLGVVVTHILVPPILAGIVSVVGLSGSAGSGRADHWLGKAYLTVAGLALVGAFAPLTHLLLVVVALLGFVLVPGSARLPRRRVVSLTALVVLPVACLLPWPVAVARNPEILVHGLGARVVEEPAGLSLLALNPGGGPVLWAGALVVLAGAVAVLVGRLRAVLPGVVVAALGWGAAFLVDSLRMVPVWGGPETVGWAGSPLLLTGAGLLWSVLAAARRPARGRLPGPVPARRAVALACVVGLAALTASAALVGRDGPLSTRTGTASPALAADLAKPGFLLAANSGPQPARFTADGTSDFGTDGIVPAPTASSWLRDAEADLLSGERERVRTAVAAAAARGAGLVALPVRAAERVRDVASDLVSDNGRLADGRPVLRLLLPNSPVELLGPALAETARRSSAPSPQSSPVEVEAGLPHVAVRVSEGGAGRLLVLAAENEAGWRARVNGESAPLATAWGHQVAVPLPEGQSEVVVTYTQVPHTTLLAVQAAAILFTLIGALPTRRRSS